PALQAAFSSGRPDIKSFDITKSSSVDSSHTLVTVVLATSNGSQQIQAIVKRSGNTGFGLYPDWRVVITPVLLSITLPNDSGGVTIDGKTISIPAGKSQIAVLPLLHRVVFNSTPLLAEQMTTVDAFSTGDQAVAYKPQFTPRGLQEAQAAVKAYFDNICVKKTSSLADAATC